MSNKSLSLFHQVSPPRTEIAEKPPLLLLLHGYGANEYDLFSLAPYLDERFFIVSAQAPVTLGQMSYAWFSLDFTPDRVIINDQEVESSRRLLHKFIGELVETYQVDQRAIYLMGFSQGAMMSLAIALTYPHTASAVVAMSGRLLPQTVKQITDKDALIGLPVFVAHGNRDTLLPIHHGRETREILNGLPVELTYREYGMAHEVSVESLQDITEWLKQRLDRSSAAEIIN